MAGIIARFVVNGVNEWGLLATIKPSNNHRYLLHDEFGYLLSYREDAQGLHC